MYTENFALKRDQIDHITRTKFLRFHNRHETQQGDADTAENTDKEWESDKNAINDLNKGIAQRRQNFRTYTDAIYAEETLYNKERRKTVYLGMANIVGLAACLYMWLG